MRHVWTTADHRFVRDNYLKMTDEELAAHIGGSVSHLLKVRTMLGLVRPKNIDGFRDRWARAKAGRGKMFWCTSRGKRIKRIKVYDGDREVVMSYARYKWIKHNGPVPDGMVVSPKDGNINNCKLDNLELRTKAKAVSVFQKTRPVDSRRRAAKKRKEWMTKKRAAQIYLNHKPYEFGLYQQAGVEKSMDAVTNEPIH